MKTKKIIVEELALSIEDMEGYQCTCKLKEYVSHACPYKAELYEDYEECNCCPYCEEQCSRDI